MNQRVRLKEAGCAEPVDIASRAGLFTGRRAPGCLHPKLGYSTQMRGLDRSPLSVLSRSKY
jgi:hypothetical protein